MISLSKDLRSQFSEARDQGSRPTCLAFAGSDIHAHARTHAFSPLSVEYLFFHSVQRTKKQDPNQGIPLSAMTMTLQTEGQPEESAWPYLDLLPTNLQEWRAPGAVTTYKFKLKDLACSIDAIIENLEKDRSVILCLNIEAGFFSPTTEGYLFSSANGKTVGSHAVLAVGYGVYQNCRYILIRNSWGIHWGLSGHAFLSEDYLQQRLYSMAGQL